MTTLHKPRLHQLEAMSFHKNNGMLGTLLWHEMGTGKAQPFSSILYTPNGPTVMGKIRVGYLVVGMDGQPKKVNAIYPQGVKKVYKVTFTDGSFTSCCEDHLWPIQSPNHRFRGGGFKVLPLKEFMNDLNAPSGNSRWAIPMTEVVRFKERKIDIPAYSLGVMIGDGSLAHDSITVTNASDTIFNKLVEDLKGMEVNVHRRWIEKGNTYSIGIARKIPKGPNAVKEGIKKYRLNVTSYFKHVPEDYKYNSLEVRLGILGGLLDTDGYIAKDGAVQFTSSSKKLVEDVIEIVQSLGGIGTINHKLTNIQTDAWTTTLKIPNEFLSCISKPQKEDRVKKLLKYPPMRYFKSVEYLGEEECQCISVDDGHYLTDSFIVTHNTTSALWLAREHLATLRQHGVTNPKFMVILPKSAVPTWKVECHKQTPDLLQSMVIYPYSQLHSAIKSLKYMDIRMIIFDESHYLKSPETSRIEVLSKFLKTVGETSGKFKNGRIMALTGTPMPNSAAELYTTWALCCAPNIEEAAERLLDVDRYENWKKTFAKKKTQSWDVGRGKNKRKNFGSKFEGVDNEEMLQKLLEPFVHYRRSEDCINLPDKEEVYVDLGLADDKLLADANLETPEMYMALLERIARAKTTYALDWVRDYLAAGEQQLLVFSNYRFPLEELSAKFPNDVRMITGSEKDAVRAQNLKDFQEGKYRVLVMTYKCGSESLNLQNTFVSLYCGYSWTDAGIKQAMARTRRSGQTKRTLHYFLTSGQNDQKILGIVRAKEEATTKVEELLLSKSKKILSVDELI